MSNAAILITHGAARDRLAAARTSLGQPDLGFGKIGRHTRHSLTCARLPVEILALEAPDSDCTTRFARVTFHVPDRGDPSSLVEYARRR